jgi:hypothetical protein
MHSSGRFHVENMPLHQCAKMTKKIFMQNCSICSSAGRVNLFSLGDIPLCDNYCKTKTEAVSQKLYPIDVIFCESCGHAELGSKAPESEIYQDYIYRTSESPGLKEHFDKYAEFVAEFYDCCQFKETATPSRKSLDIGGNDGLLASFLSQKGFNSFVLDPSPSIQFCGSNIHQIKCYFNNDSAAKLISEHGYFQVITANNVIANVRDPDEFFSCIANLLNPSNGLLILESGYLPSMLDNNVVEMFNHEHYHYYTCSSLAFILQKHGMKILSFEPISAKGGSFRCVAALRSCNNDSSINPLLSDAGAIVEKSQSLVSTLSRYKKIVSSMSDPLVGFGAFAGGTILTFALNLQDRLSWLIDDNHCRHGLFSPHLGLEIKSPEILSSLQGPSVIVLAWRFKQQIATRHSLLFNQCKQCLYLFDG